MGKKRGRKDGMSESEYRKYLKEFRAECPKESCDGYACFCDLGWGKFLQCNECGKTFGYQDGRGSSISKQKYDALAERANSRPAKSAGTSCPAEEGAMAKVTKKSKKKAAKKSSKGATKTARTPEERVSATASGYAVSLIVTTSLDDAAVAKKVIAKFSDAPATYRAEQKHRMIPHIRKNILAGKHEWAKGLKGYKKPVAVAKPKAAPKKKAKAKVKKVAKK